MLNGKWARHLWSVRHMLKVNWIIQAIPVKAEENPIIRGVLKVNINLIIRIDKKKKNEYK